MIHGPAQAFGTTPGAETHSLVILILLPYVAIFLYAAWVELRRWYLYGPSRNNRALFSFDTSAPSFEHPGKAQSDKR